MKFVSRILFFQLVCFSLYGGDIDTFYLSKLYSNSKTALPLFDQYLLMPNKSDTLVYSFYLENDMDKDTALYLFERENEVILCRCKSKENLTSIDFKTGTTYAHVVASDYYIAPYFKFNVAANTKYDCTMKVLGAEFFGVRRMYFLSEINNIKEVNRIRKHNSSRDIITFVYIGIVLFNIILLSVIYFLSKNGIFGWYIFYLFFHLLYGCYLINLESWVGALFSDGFVFSTAVTETIIFTGQIIYIYFVFLWLDIKSHQPKYQPLFFIVMICYVVYILMFDLFYWIDKRDVQLNTAMSIIRLLSLFIQGVLFYIIIYKVKNNMKYFIIGGSLSVVFFGVVMSAASVYNAFSGWKIDELSTGSWYMIGSLFEVLFFSIGLGYYYYTIQSENSNLLIEKLESVNLKLKADEEKLNERIRISQDLHDQIGSTLSSIAVYSQVAKLKEKEEESLKEILDKIADASNEMTSDISDIVWSIHPKNDRLDKIIERMESFAKPLAKVRNIDFEITYDPNLMHLTFEMDQRKNFFLIFKEAVNNAIKYSAAKKYQSSSYEARRMVHHGDNR